MGERHFTKAIPGAGGRTETHRTMVKSLIKQTHDVRGDTDGYKPITYSPDDEYPM